MVGEFDFGMMRGVLIECWAKKKKDRVWKEIYLDLYLTAMDRDTLVSSLLSSRDAFIIFMIGS